MGAPKWKTVTHEPNCAVNEKEGEGKLIEVAFEMVSWVDSVRLETKIPIYQFCSPVETLVLPGKPSRSSLKVKFAQVCLTLQSHGLYSPWKFQIGSQPQVRGSRAWKFRTRVYCISGSFFTSWASMDWNFQSMEISTHWSGWLFPPPGNLPNPGDQTQVSHIAGRFFTSWATREAQEYWSG